jgi:hypothetical protein
MVMKRRTIVLILATLIVFIGVSFFLYQSYYGRAEYILIEVLPPDIVYGKFENHPEAWDEVFENVSSVVEFWNATIPSNLANRSVPEIAAMFGGEINLSDSEYAFCYISVPENNCQALNQTLTGIGFKVEKVHYMEPETY